MKRLHLLILSFRRCIIDTKLTPLDCSNYKKENSSKDVQFNLSFKSGALLNSIKGLHALALRSRTTEIKCHSFGSGIGSEAYKLRCTLWGTHKICRPLFTFSLLGTESLHTILSSFPTHIKLIPLQMF